MTAATTAGLASDLDLATFRSTAKAKLLQAPAREARWSDYDLNPNAAREPTPPRPAAVLIPVIARPAPTLLLTKRTEHLSTHAGQIAFPGGRIESTDESPAAAALREANEEIGLDPSVADILGYLDPYRTSTNFIVTPVVAILPATFSPAPNAAEVETVFEVPLAFLMNEANHQIASRVWRGAARQFYAMPYHHHYIWGATAGMIKMLYRRLFTA